MDEFDKVRFGTSEQKKTSPIPLSRIRDRLDLLTGKKEYAAAVRLLIYWKTEARLSGDVRGEFFVLNELMGVYRKSEDPQRAVECAEETLLLNSVPEISGTVGAGTGYVNAGTVFKYAGNAAKALECFEKARQIYESLLDEGDARLGGLYNNMALALMDMNRVPDACFYFDTALEVMRKQPLGAREQAITLLNMADAVVREMGIEKAEERVNACLADAEKLLMDPSLPQDDYHAFVCEKCAPVFSYYGWFKTASELENTAEQIRSRS